MCLLQGAKAFAAGSVGGEDAVASFYKGGDQVAVFVVICRSLLFYDFLGCGIEEGINLGHQFTEAFVFFIGQGGAGITFDAAGTEA